VVEQKAAAQKAAWDEMWSKKLTAENRILAKQQVAFSKQAKKSLAIEKTNAAREAVGELNDLLRNFLAGTDEKFNWERLKDTSEFNIPAPSKRVVPKPNLLTVPWNLPVQTNSKYQPRLGILDHLATSRKKKKLEQSQRLFESDCQRWQEEAAETAKANEEKQKLYESELRKSEEEYQTKQKAWEDARQSFLTKQQENNEAIVNRKKEYFAAMPDAIVEYSDIVLSFSRYPDYFPRDFELDYDPETKMLVVDYSLPSLDDLPRLKEVKYVQTRDEFLEIPLSESEVNRLYDSLLYQIALRVTHEVYDLDIIEAIYSIVFNGWVKFIDKATGNQENACIISLQTDRSEFVLINLHNIEPKTCFKSMKGVGSSKLHSLTPIQPILMIDREDKRFVPSHDVTDALDERSNLAAMDWEDFEHLIRELFEKELAQSGGEVKVTQASRDGGVDAIAFDPDPIRGGKIVIQAKRYTNVVGVSAVRDLYGTVMNEGATKGILVTTATFGPDAYDFAKGKPLTLLNGGNLLHLLEKHGHRAKIDLREAKRIIAEREKEKGNRANS
jgi:restriction system protein